MNSCACPRNVIYRFIRDNLNTLNTISVIKKRGVGPLYLMLHGLQGTKELFSTLIEESLFQDSAILAPDLPGFGETAPLSQSTCSLSSFSTLIEDLVLSSGHTEVVIIGHSLGGMIGTKLLTSRTVEVRALISLEGNLTLEDCGASKEIASLSTEDFRNLYLPKKLGELAASSTLSATFRLHALKQADPITIFYSAQSVVEECREGKLLTIFNKSLVPRLLLVGAESSFSTRKVENGALCTIVPNAGHFLLHDNYNFVINQITNFIKQIPANNKL